MVMSLECRDWLGGGVIGEFFLLFFLSVLQNPADQCCLGSQAD